MITMLIGAIIGAILAVKRFYWCSDTVESIVNGIFGSIAGMILSFPIALCLPMDTYKKETILKLESLQDNSGVSGKFFLGSGSIDGTMNYVFYYETDGFYKMEMVDYKNARIKYSDDAPTATVIENNTSDSWINYFAIDLDFKKEYVIQVPKGTIQNNFNLDAK